MSTPNNYAPSDYDRHLCLKVPALLIAALFFSVRHLFIVFLAYNPSPKLAAAFDYLQAYQSPIYLLSDLPALLVLLAWFKRVPDAGHIWRWIWHRGRYLLTITLLLQFGLVSANEWQGLRQAFYFSDSQRFVILNLGLDVLLIYYLWRFAIVRDVFADFPSHADTSHTSANSDNQPGQP